MVRNETDNKSAACLRLWSDKVRNAPQIAEIAKRSVTAMMIEMAHKPPPAKPDHKKYVLKKAKATLKIITKKHDRYAMQAEWPAAKRAK
jgi:hypothetical protein